jgi:predicted amidohydrolase YtcJ
VHAVTAAAPLLFRRARIYTPDPAPVGHDCLAVVDGHIAAVGTEEQCRSVLPAGHSDVDLAGRSLVPGFIDAHVHPMVMSVFELHLRFDGALSLADVLDAVADAARSAEADQAVIGFQLDDALLAERRLPTAAELDAAASGRPVVIVRRDGHHAVGSSAAIRGAGLDDPSRMIAGGYVERGPDGRPTGLVGENAVAALTALMPEITTETLEAGRARWTARLLGQGVTAISAICQTSAEGPSGPPGEMEAVGWSDLVQRVPFDVQTILIASEPSVVDDYRAIPSLHDPEAGRRIDAVKLFLDGTLGGASACMHSPFADRSHTSGMRTLGDEEAYARMEAAHLAGLQVCVHAIGDRANLDAALLFQRLLREHPGPHRHRVEHASVLDPRTVELFAENQITCVVQPINLRSEVHWIGDRLGPERLLRTYPYRSLLDAGVPVAGSSDAPIEDTDVLAAIDACVDRGGLADHEAITPVEALAMYTAGGSAARSTEDRLGTLSPGSRADLVVLSGDLATTRAADLEVEATYIGGVEHHRAAPHPA